MLKPVVFGSSLFNFADAHILERFSFLLFKF
jgi:hypothetical protein